RARGRAARSCARPLPGGRRGRSRRRRYGPVRRRSRTGSWCSDLVEGRSPGGRGEATLTLYVAPAGGCPSGAAVCESGRMTSHVPVAADHVVTVHDEGRRTGTFERAAVHTTETPPHLAVSCYVLDDAAPLLLTRRAPRTRPGARRPRGRRARVPRPRGRRVGRRRERDLPRVHRARRGTGRAEPRRGRRGRVGRPAGRRARGRRDPVGVQPVDGAA